MEHDVSSNCDDAMRYSGSDKSDQIRISQTNSFFLTDFFRCARFPDKSDQLQKKSAQLATNTAVRWVRAARWHVFFFAHQVRADARDVRKFRQPQLKSTFHLKSKGGPLDIGAVVGPISQLLLQISRFEQQALQIPGLRATGQAGAA